MWSEQHSILTTCPNIELYLNLFAESISQLSQGLVQQARLEVECRLGDIIQKRFNCTQLTLTYKSLSHTTSKCSLQPVWTLYQNMFFCQVHECTIFLASILSKKFVLNVYFSICSWCALPCKHISAICVPEKSQHAVEEAIKHNAKQRVCEVAV